MEGLLRAVLTVCQPPFLQQTLMGNLLQHLDASKTEAVESANRAFTEINVCPCSARAEHVLLLRLQLNTVN